MQKQISIIDPYDNELYTLLWKYKGRKKPKAVIQIVHGAGEHISRYNEFAEYLNDEGYIVIGNDHLGHGENAKDKDYIHFSDEIGYHKVLGGIQVVREYIEKEYPQVPIILLGHSMGSFFGRYALLQNKAKYHAAIFTGSAWLNIVSINAALLLAKGLIRSQGSTHVSEKFTNFTQDKAIKSMMKNGLINKRIEWITHDKKIQQQVLNCELCGKPFTVGAQQDMFQLIKEIQNKKAIEEQATSIPIYFISGDLDALGDYGIAAKKLHKIYTSCGYTNVTYSIINGARHEVLNEIDKKDTYKRITEWMERYI